MTGFAATERISRTRTLTLTFVATVVSAFALAAVHPPDADAACNPPSISGTLQVGSTLKAEAGSCSDLFPPNKTLQWYRCTGTTAATCTTSVKAAQGSPSSYKATSADAGKRLGVKQVATGALPPAEVDWRISGVIQQPAQPPPPPPPPDDDDDDDGGGGGTGGGGGGTGGGGGGTGGGGDPGGGGGGTGGGGGGGGGGQQGTPLLNPFPVVTIAGRLTRRGARVIRLFVRAPEGSTVRVRCRGRGCRATRGKRTIGTEKIVRLRRFQRHLRSGTVLRVAVTRPGFVGKFTRFKFRRRRPPLRSDLCVMAGSVRPIECPA